MLTAVSFELVWMLHTHYIPWRDACASALHTWHAAFTSFCMPVSLCTPYTTAASLSGCTCAGMQGRRGLQQVLRRFLHCLPATVLRLTG
jgi:hypothetical protein